MTGNSCWSWSTEQISQNQNHCADTSRRFTTNKIGFCLTTCDPPGPFQLRFHPLCSLLRDDTTWEHHQQICAKPTDWTKLISRAPSWAEQNGNVTGGGKAFWYKNCSFWQAEWTPRLYSSWGTQFSQEAEHLNSSTFTSRAQLLDPKDSILLC